MLLCGGLYCPHKGTIPFMAHLFRIMSVLSQADVKGRKAYRKK